jgi:Predicted metal-sulfur cluster biosynthetic enzyme
MTHEDILQALGNVQEPDLGKDIVTLNMVKDITIEGNMFLLLLCSLLPLPFERLDQKQLYQSNKEPGK